MDADLFREKARKRRLLKTPCTVSKKDKELSGGFPMSNTSITGFMRLPQALGN